MGIGGEKVAGTPYIVTRGVVLRETETRDADKILTVLTAEQGKIAVIARGARRKSCKFAACAQPQGAAVRRRGRCSRESQSLLRHRRLLTGPFGL